MHAGSMHKGLTAIAILALGGCSAGGIFDLPAHQAQANDAPESYYKFLVADSAMVRQLRKNAQMAPLQVSGLRRTVAPQPGDWVTCLRVWELGKRQVFYAIFIRNRAIIESRTGVVIDRCEGEQFSPLPAIYVPEEESDKDKQR